MPLPESGPISLNQMHIEAGGTSGTLCTINDADIRGLIGKASGEQSSFSEFYGASSDIDVIRNPFYADELQDINTNLLGPQYVEDLKTNSRAYMYTGGSMWTLNRDIQYELIDVPDNNITITRADLLMKLQLTTITNSVGAIENGKSSRDQITLLDSDLQQTQILDILATNPNNIGPSETQTNNETFNFDLLSIFNSLGVNHGKALKGGMTMFHNLRMNQEPAYLYRWQMNLQYSYTL